MEHVRLREVSGVHAAGVLERLHDARLQHLDETIAEVRARVAQRDHELRSAEEQLADLAGVSRGLMYHYFSSKRDFFADIIRRVGVPEIEERLLAAVEAELAVNIGVPERAQ